MLRNKVVLLIILFFLLQNVQAQKRDLTEKEQASSNFVVKFFKTLHKEPITYVDSSNSKINKASSPSPIKNDYINEVYDFSEYIFITNFNNDSAKALPNKAIYVQREIKELSGFISRKNLNYIEVRPLRLNKDNYIYTKLTTFQKENTFSVFDTRSPENVFFYVLLIPGKSIGLSSPKIFSWKLEFSFGEFFFRDVIGQEGIEFFFEGVKGISSPNNNK